MLFIYYAIMCSWVGSGKFHVVISCARGRGIPTFGGTIEHSNLFRNYNYIKIIWVNE